jgi:hypothetical protein
MLRLLALAVTTGCGWPPGCWLAGCPDARSQVREYDEGLDAAELEALAGDDDDDDDDDDAVGGDGSEGGGEEGEALGDAVGGARGGGLSALGAIGAALRLPAAALARYLRQRRHRRALLARSVGLSRLIARQVLRVCLIARLLAFVLARLLAERSISRAGLSSSVVARP